MTVRTALKATLLVLRSLCGTNDAGTGPPANNRVARLVNGGMQDVVHRLNDASFAQNLQLCDKQDPALV